MNGERMRELRQQLRFSQADLKEALNQMLGRSYDKPKISRWENGRDPIPADVSMALNRLVEGKGREARTIVFANQKGGVGKTTSALNLAYALSRGITGCCWSIWTPRPPPPSPFWPTAPSKPIASAGPWRR